MFKQAKPVFVAGYRDELNLFFGFYTRIPQGKETLLRITGSSLYSIFVNGEFVFSGPARAAHDRYRVDEISLSPYLTEVSNVIAIRLAAYQCNSHSSTDVPGFLCAEVETDGMITAHTDADGSFRCVRLDQRLQKVIRYSYQRNFSEAYRLDKRYDLFCRDPEHSGHEEIPLVRTEEKCFLPRGVFYPLFETEYPTKMLAGGTMAFTPEKGIYQISSALFQPNYKNYTDEELEFNCMADALSYTAEPGVVPDCDPRDISLEEMSYVEFCFQTELTGMFQMELETDGDAKLQIIFDEVYNGNRVNLMRWASVASCITLFVKGNCNFMTLEPYSAKYFRLVCTQGRIRVRNFRIRRTGYPDCLKRFPVEDPELRRIYDAAIETFRQNTYDIFMDCPSRERAGWLCDSFFTARAEYALTGQSQVEKNFLGNFIYSPRFPWIAQGMLPMCYPSDVVNGEFIANWALWFILELGEYLERSGDVQLIADARERVMGLMAFMKKLENENGMLEHVPGWVFVEWSRSNDLVQDVNYPSNMLYAKAKRVAAKLYGMDDLAAEAEQMETFIRENTMVNGFFCDNSLRQSDGSLKLSGECTESCQYYAFYMGIATPETHPELWHVLTTDFGPHRKKDNKHPHIAFANAFIGNFLRLDLLARYGLKKQLEDEIRGYFLYMADKTGTLWENDSDRASCNHGFASYAAVLLKKALQ